ncbi:MAG TPA: DcaP family trimeric outer membrane transporter [Terriglobia bacterium]|nr:DcaP family trimeric outer membrane transporter [Terriglobia bacterium]
MQELKGQINTLEKAQAAPAQATPQASPSQAEPAPARPAAVVPSASAAAQLTAIKPEKPAAEKKPQTTMDLYGFAMTDTGYDFGQTDPNWFDVVRPTKLPSFANEFGANGNVYFSVRQTRFGVKTSTPTALGDLKTQFEFELFGTGVDAGQATFRLRHAYGELGPLLVGQTNSAFMDIDVFPNSLEYWGPNGMVFFRNVQIRWTPIRSDHTELALALERPGASADQGVYSDRIELSNITPHFNLPDFTGHVRETRKWGYVQLAGIVRKIGWTDNNATPTLNLSGTAVGWGLNLSSNLNFGPKDIGRFEVVYGQGIQNYMNDAPIDVGVKNNFGNPVTPITGKALPLLGVVSFLDHNWSERFTSSIGYSMLNIYNSDAEKTSDFHQGHYALTNLLFKPVPNVMVGGEFQFGRRVNFSDGFNVNDYRLQFSFKYNWSKTLGLPGI